MMLPDDAENAIDGEAGLADMSAAQREWVDRCQASIVARDPLLGADDTLDLAATLWDRPSCQLLAPEAAAELLFAGRLSQSI